jgi:ribosomal subunit interface protein
MKIVVTGKQIDVGDSLRSHVETSMASVVEKYFVKAIEAHVVFSRLRHQFCAELSVHAGRGLMMQASNEAEDAYAAFDGAAERLDKRLRRHKRRLRNHHKTKGEGGEEAATDYVLSADETGGTAAGGDQPLVIAEIKTSIPHLSVSEAVMRLDLADLPALLFRNSAHGNLNLLYRRRDGNLGWIDPALVARSNAVTDKAQ